MSYELGSLYVPSARADVSTVDIDWSMVDQSMPRCVDRGLLYVQRTYPEAARRIRLDSLDMLTKDSCVLGQIHGNYTDSPEYRERGADFCVAHGFYIRLTPGDNVAELYDTLTALWSKALSAWFDRS